MARKFNLADYVEQAESNLDKRKQLEYIPLNQIRPDPRNFYSTDGIEELADSIQTVGLIDPLWLRQLAPESYQVISGHRRRLAYELLVVRGDFPADGAIPVFVDRGAGDLPGVDEEKREEARPLFDRLKLVLANSDTRDKTPADRVQEVRELTEVFEKLRALGFRFPGNMREHIAAAAHMSESRVARLRVIEKGLTGANLRACFGRGQLGENAAYEIARRAPEVVARADSAAAFLCRQTLEQLGAVLDQYERDLAEEKDEAERLSAGLRTMAEAAADTSSAAAAAPSPQGEGRGSASFDAEAYIEKRKQEDDAFFSMLADFADPRLIDYASCAESRREGIARLKRYYGGSHIGHWGDAIDSDSSPKGLSLLRDKDAKRGPITRTWTEVYDMLAALALSRWASENSNGGLSGAPVPAEEPAAEDAEPGADWSDSESDAGSFFVLLSDLAEDLVRDMYYIDSRADGIEELKYAETKISGNKENLRWEGDPDGLSLEAIDRDGPVFMPWRDVYDMICALAIQHWGDQIRHNREAANSPQWLTGAPTRRGRYFCRIDMKDGGIHEQRCYWGDDGWSCYGSNLKANGWEVIDWWPLPKEG